MEESVGGRTIDQSPEIHGGNVTFIGQQITYNKADEKPQDAPAAIPFPAALKTYVRKNPPILKQTLSHDPTDQLDLNDVYVEPQYINEDAKSEQTQLLTHYSMIFARLDSRFVVIKGGPGSGKTTLCLKMLDDWAAERVEMEAFELVLLIDFRTIAAHRLYTSLEELVSRELSVQAAGLNQWMSKPENQKRVLFLFDGRDDYPKKDTDDIIQDILKEVTEKLLNGEATDFQLWLRSNQTVAEYARIPLICRCLCAYWKKRKTLPQDEGNLTITKIYRTIVNLLVTREKRQQSQGNEKEIGRKEAKKLRSIALKTILQKQTAFHQEELTDIGKEYQNGLVTMTYRTGIGDEKCEFIHKTIQEYLAAECIVYHPEDEGVKIFWKQIQQCNSFDELREFENILIFIFGLSNDPEAGEHRTRAAQQAIDSLPLERAAATHAGRELVERRAECDIDHWLLVSQMAGLRDFQNSWLHCCREANDTALDWSRLLTSVCLSDARGWISEENRALLLDQLRRNSVRLSEVLVHLYVYQVDDFQTWSRPIGASRTDRTGFWTAISKLENLKTLSVLTHMEHESSSTLFEVLKESSEIKSLELWPQWCPTKNVAAKCPSIDEKSLARFLNTSSTLERLILHHCVLSGEGQILGRMLNNSTREWWGWWRHRQYAPIREVTLPPMSLSGCELICKNLWRFVRLEMVRIELHSDYESSGLAKSLQRLNGLKELQLKNMNSKAFRLLCEALQGCGKGLRRLNLSNSEICDHGGELIKFLQIAENLRKIDLRNCQLTENSFSALLPVLLKLPSIRVIELSANQPTENTMKLLEGLPLPTQLDSLELTGNRFSWGSDRWRQMESRHGDRVVL